MNERDATADGLVPTSSLSHRVVSALGGYSPIMRWYRALRPRWLWLRVSPSGRSMRMYLKGNGMTVKRGFAEGIRYPRHAVARVGSLTTKLVGAFERELDPVLRSEVPSHDLFVDIGSGDGYYCLATARRFPNVRTIGYETDATERALACEMAAINEVGCEFRGTADPDEIAALPAGRLFLMADVEGYEYELCDPEKIPRLREATILIEVHPSTREGLRQILIDRFESTHSHQVIHGRAKDFSEYPELADWPVGRGNLAVTEGRSKLPEWLFLKPLIETPDTLVTN